MVEEVAHDGELRCKEDISHNIGFQDDVSVGIQSQREEEEHVAEQELDRLAVIVSQNDLGNWQVERKHRDKDVQDCKNVEEILLPDTSRLLVDHDGLPARLLAFGCCLDVENGLAESELVFVNFDAGGWVSEELDQVHLVATDLLHQAVEELID